MPAAGPVLALMLLPLFFFFALEDGKNVNEYVTDGCNAPFVHLNHGRVKPENLRAV